MLHAFKVAFSLRLVQEKRTLSNHVDKLWQFPSGDALSKDNMFSGVLVNKRSRQFSLRPKTDRFANEEVV